MMQNRFNGKHSYFKKMLFALFASIVLCAHASAESDNVSSLRAEYEALKAQLEHNQFKRPLVLDSTEAQDQLKGSVYAVVDHSFGEVRTGLNSPDHWCDILFLHMNTKYCQADKDATGAILNVNIGKKTPEELEDSSRIVFNYKVAAITPDYLKIMLNADEGPMGTSNYRIVLEAVELTNAKTFIHLTYSYAVSVSGRLATKAYLATAGSDKVGFTVTGRQPDGTPEYIKGVRGIIERNTMRYYLAIDAFLAAANATPNAQLDKRLQTWFASTERYRRQLHEMELNDYLQMKRAENVRQLSMR
jgi:hypothetical protein